MSSKAHFIYTDGIEGYEETNEPQSIFGKHRGFNAYLVFDPGHIRGIQIVEDYIYLTVTPFDDMPSKFRIWGDAILQFDYDDEGLLICLKGGHYITCNIIKNIYDQETK